MQASGELRNHLEADRLEACHSLQRVGHVVARDLARDEPRCWVLSTWPEMAQRCVSSLCKMLGEEGLELVEGDEIQPIVQVHMSRAWNNVEFLGRPPEQRRLR